MKKNEVVVGETYLARVSGRLVPVRVDRARVVSTHHRNRFSGLTDQRERTLWDCTNTRTGREITVRSAQRFRGVYAKPS